MAEEQVIDTPSVKTSRPGWLGRGRLTYWVIAAVVAGVAVALTVALRLALGGMEVDNATHVAAVIGSWVLALAWLVQASYRLVRLGLGPSMAALCVLSLYMLVEATRVASTQLGLGELPVLAWVFGDWAGPETASDTAPTSAFADMWPHGFLLVIMGFALLTGLLPDKAPAVEAGQKRDTSRNRYYIQSAVLVALFLLLTWLTGGDGENEVSEGQAFTTVLLTVLFIYMFIMNMVGRLMNAGWPDSGIEMYLGALLLLVVTAVVKSDSAEMTFIVNAVSVSQPAEGAEGFWAHVPRITVVCLIMLLVIGFLPERYQKKPKPPKPKGKPVGKKKGEKKPAPDKQEKPVQMDETRGKQPPDEDVTPLG